MFARAKTSCVVEQGEVCGVYSSGQTHLHSIVTFWGIQSFWSHKFMSVFRAWEEFSSQRQRKMRNLNSIRGYNFLRQPFFHTKTP